MRLRVDVTLVETGRLVDDEPRVLRPPPTAGRDLDVGSPPWHPIDLARAAVRHRDRKGTGGTRRAHLTAPRQRRARHSVDAVVQRHPHGPDASVHLPIAEVA